VLSLTVLLPLLTIIVFIIVSRSSKNYHPLTISILMLLGIWLLGPLFMFIGASFSSGGFYAPNVFGSRLVFLLWTIVTFPAATFMMATYDGALGALLIVTLTLILVWIPKRKSSNGTYSEKQPLIAVATVVAISLLSFLAINVTGGLLYRYMKDQIKVKAIEIEERKKWVGKELPNFTFDTMEEGLSPLYVKDMRGRTSVLIFWAAYNTPWSSNFKYARDLYAQRDKLKINVYIIAVDKSKDSVKNYLNKQLNDLPVYYDPNSRYNHSLKIFGAADKILIIDGETRLQAVLEAPDNFQDIISALNRIK
jgi:peroxiredoxin